MTLPDAERTEDLEALAQLCLFLEHVRPQVFTKHWPGALPVLSDEVLLPQ